MYKLMGRSLQSRPGAPRNGSPMLRAVTVPGTSRISSLMVATCIGTQNIRETERERLDNVGHVLRCSTVRILMDSQKFFYLHLLLLGA